MLQQSVFADRGAMTLQDFCKWAGIGRTLAYSEISSGRLKTVKVGKRRLVVYRDALTWIETLQSAAEG